jgi:hypothetical protein
MKIMFIGVEMIALYTFHWYSLLQFITRRMTVSAVQTILLCLHEISSVVAPL